MARPLRIEYEGAFYHVTARGNERKKIFFNKSDYKKFKDYLVQAQDKYDYLIHCYTLMTNHYHLLIETPNGNLRKIMHFLNGSYTNYINRRRRRSGHLLQGRYKAILIDKDNYLIELSRYVHLNPVRAKMVDKPEDYPHSSYRSYISKGKEEFVHRDLILSMVSQDDRNSTKRYKAFVERGINEGLEDPLGNIYGGMILGGKRFIRDVLDMVKFGVIQKQETSHRKDLHSAYAVDHIIDIVACDFKISPDDVTKKNGESRNIAIYLTKKFTSIGNKQLGGLFGGLSYSAVSKANQRFTEKLKKDKRLRRRVENIIDSMSYVKG